jgi:site-specific recombinase XerD
MDHTGLAREGNQTARRHDPIYPSPGQANNPAAQASRGQAAGARPAWGSGLSPARYVAKEVRRALALERPQVRTRRIERLSREKERRLMEAAYRLTGTRGWLLKTLLQTGSRVSAGVAIEGGAVFFDEQMLLIRKAQGGKRRYVPSLPELAQERRTHRRDHTQGDLFETNRHAAFSPRRIPQLVKETADLAGITQRVTPHTLRHAVAPTLLEHGMPLEQIQQCLGHAQLDTTPLDAAATTAMIKESDQQALSR